MRANRQEVGGGFAGMERRLWRPVLRFIPLALLLVACIPPDEGDGGLGTFNDEDLSSHEQRIWYADMIQAYRSGQPARARQLAQAYLERDLNHLAAALTRREWEGSLERLIVIEREILYEEILLPPAERLGGRDSELMNFFESALRKTRNSFRSQEFILPENVETQAYYERKLGMAARDWLVTQVEHVSPQELLTIFREYKGELLEIGISDLASALKPPPLMELPTRRGTVGGEPGSPS